MVPFLTLAAAGLSLAAAEAPRPSPTATVDKAAPAAKVERRYCVQYEITGSYLPQKTCKTLGEWKKDGVDITARQ